MREPGAEGQLRALGPPAVPAAEHATRGTVNATGGADALHHACRLAQAGGVADELWCELYFQTVADPSVAPDGPPRDERVLPVRALRLAEGTWDERRDEIADRVEALDRALRARASASSWSSARRSRPPDVERKIGLTGGHIFQGECLPEYMWDRRLPYRTGAEGVYLCGAGDATRAAA